MNRGQSATRNFTTIVRAFVGALLVVAALAATPAAAQAAVYWGNADNDRIGRVENSGANPMPSFITGLAGPQGLAAVDGRLYWADYNAGTIGRADLSGSTPIVDREFITGIDGPVAVAADEDHVYWGTDGRISRAVDANGTLGLVETELVTRDTGYEIGYVVGLAVRGQEIYWSAADSSSISRATLLPNGEMPAVDANLQSINGAGGIAVAGDHLYWVNASGTSLGRARLEPNGLLGDISQNFITGARDPFGLAISGSEIFWTNRSSAQPGTGSLSRATLGGDGNVQVRHDLLFDSGEMLGVAIDNPRDLVAPFISMTPLAPESGWFSGVSDPDGVLVEVNASDLSGVTGLSCTDGVNTVLDTGSASGSFTLFDGVHDIDCTATDGAGNSGAGPNSAAFPVRLQVDLTAPEILCGSTPAAWVANNVEVTCSSSDGGSGLANILDDAQFSLLTSVLDGSYDASAQTGTHAVTDVAGNTNIAGPLTAQVDRELPTITCPDPPVLELGGTATPLVATVTDAGAGPASPTATGATSTAVAGDQTTTVTASDAAGNSSSIACLYSVAEKPKSKYVFKGLRNLRDRSFRHGADIRLRFRLTDVNGKPVKDAIARLSIVTADGSDAKSSVSISSGDLFRHVGRGRYWYMLDTGNLPGPGKYEVRVSLDDGSVHTAPLNLRAKRGHHGV